MASILCCRLIGNITGDDIRPKGITHALCAILHIEGWEFGFLYSRVNYLVQFKTSKILYMVKRSDGILKR